MRRRTSTHRCIASKINWGSKKCNRSNRVTSQLLHSSLQSMLLCSSQPPSLEQLDKLSKAGSGSLLSTFSLIAEQNNWTPGGGGASIRTAAQPAGSRTHLIPSGGRGRNTWQKTSAVIGRASVSYVGVGVAVRVLACADVCMHKSIRSFKKKVAGDAPPLPPPPAHPSIHAHPPFHLKT